MSIFERIACLFMPARDYVRFENLSDWVKKELREEPLQYHFVAWKAKKPDTQQLDLKT